MTADEFKAWFHGFLEGIGEKTPTKAQFDRIREKVKELQGPPRVRYEIAPPPWNRPWRVWPEIWSGTASGTPNRSQGGETNTAPYFYSLGKSDAEAE